MRELTAEEAREEDRVCIENLSIARKDSHGRIHQYLEEMASNLTKEEMISFARDNGALCLIDARKECETYKHPRMDYNS